MLRMKYCPLLLILEDDMRVTQKSIYIPFQKSLEDIQERKFIEETKLTTGKNINSVSDNPAKLGNVKRLNDMISRTKNYQSNIQYAMNELRAVSDVIDSISERLHQIRQLSIDSTNVGNSGNLSTLGTYVKGLIEDVVNSANQTYNGQFLFSGTKTTENSIIPTPPEKNNLPFEIIKEEPTPQNPSGYNVVFKGNFVDRFLNKDSLSSEVINTKADELFGDGGKKMFESLFNLYNLLVYNENGELRKDTDVFKAEDISRLDLYQKEISQFNEQINGVAARNGIRMNRFELINEQLNNEILRLKSYVSQDEDTDFAETIMRLNKEQTALQYTLQVGAKLGSQTLFDFLR